MKQHSFKCTGTSSITHEGKSCKIEKYLCIECDRLLIIDFQTRKRIHLKGAIGEEIEDDWR